MTENIWNKKEVEKAIRIIKRAEDKKPEPIKNLDKSIYWIVLVIVVLGNIAVSIMLIPILLVLRSFMLYLIIVILGVSFGLLYDVLLRDLGTLDKKRHVIATLYVPITAIINLYIITSITNKLEFTLRLNNDQHSLLLVGFTYAIAFIFPYLYYNFMAKRIKNQKNF